MVLIYLYIVTRAKIIDFFANIKFITEFVSKETRKGSRGFFLATYETSLYTLLDNKKDQLGRKSSPIDIPTKPNMVDGSRDEECGFIDSGIDARGSLMPNDLYKSKRNAFVDIEINESKNY